MDETEKFQGKFRIPSSRLQDWNYGGNANYFITICTKDRAHFFGQIIEKEMHLNDIGQLAANSWRALPNRFPNIILGNFIVMPNHVHGVIEIYANQHAHNNDQTTTTINSRFQRPGRGSLSSIIGSYKSVVAKGAHLLDPMFGWQSSFHDHVIRNNKALEKIQQYIMTNPANWISDMFYD